MLNCEAIALTVCVTFRKDQYNIQYFHSESQHNYRHQNMLHCLHACRVKYCRLS
jgi:hypothetical protein